jgi:hypothetical protein
MAEGHQDEHDYAERRHTMRKHASMEKQASSETSVDPNECACVVGFNAMPWSFVVVVVCAKR